jgi:dTDP-4-dehydrorhamnose 3,5-epimerase
VIFHETPLFGAFRIELQHHVDHRGSFARSFCERELEQHGLPTRFPQSNLSYNYKAGTLRGMHYNVARFAEAKLVRAASGAILDVIVDLRRGSPTRLKSYAAELRADQGTALFVPAGFAHGFLTLEDNSCVHYQMGAFYEPEAARGFRYDDPLFGLVWPRPPSVIAERDASYPNFDLAEYDA